jgi:hypothetical protein
MSLEEIADILAGPAATRRWAHVVEDQIEARRVQIEQMEAARGFLQHALEFHRTLPRTDALTTGHTSSNPRPATTSRPGLPARITPSSGSPRTGVRAVKGTRRRWPRRAAAIAWRVTCLPSAGSVVPGKAPGVAAVTWALTRGRHNSESQAMRPATGSQCGVCRSIRGEEWK